MCGVGAGRGRLSHEKNNYNSNRSNMGRGENLKDKDKDPKEKARQEKAAAELANREKRLHARAVSQSLNDGLSGGAAAAATAAASMGAKGGKGARNAESPPRNPPNEDSESVCADSPVLTKGRRSGRRVEPTCSDHSEEDGADKSAASESENEELTTNCKTTATQKLKERAGIQVDSNAT